MKFVLRYDGFGVKVARFYLAIVNPFPVRFFIGGFEWARVANRTDTHVTFYPFKLYRSK